MAEFTDLYDDGVPFEQLRRTHTPAAERSWCFEYFEVQILHGQTYNPKGSTKKKMDRRLRCKRCKWGVLDSIRQGSIGNLIRHLL